MIEDGPKILAERRVLLHWVVAMSVNEAHTFSSSSTRTMWLSGVSIGWNSEEAFYSQAQSSLRSNVTVKGGGWHFCLLECDSHEIIGKYRGVGIIIALYVFSLEVLGEERIFVAFFRYSFKFHTRVQYRLVLLAKRINKRVYLSL